LGWGGEGDETFPKFAESFAKILAKFHELKISKKPQHYIPYVNINVHSNFSNILYMLLYCIGMQWSHCQMSHGQIIKKWLLIAN